MKKNNIVVILLIVCAALLIAVLLFLNKGRNFFGNNGQLSSEADIAQTIAALSEVMVLPADETPSIATVLDKDKLDGQAFFANAQNGDKMIIYTNAKKAILFRPSEKLVVEVMPLLIGDNAASPTPAPSASTENSTSNTFSEGE